MAPRKATLEDVCALIGELKKDVGEVKSEIKGLRDDLTSLRLIVTSNESAIASNQSAIADLTEQFKQQILINNRIKCYGYLKQYRHGMFN